MSYEGLARKYRPQTFADVVGQDHVTRTLRNAIETGRISHAYLFIGPRGIGKTTLSRIFAKSLDCEKGPNTEPCLQCDTCKEIAAGISLDVLEIDGASNNGVDQVRALRDQLQFPPTRAKYKIVIIDEVHMLSAGAFNALLKTLEEPPPYVVFIFATTEGDKLLPTIISRCQRFDLRRIQTNQIAERLRYICNAENIEADDDALLALARGAEGGLRDACSSLDQLIAFCGNKLTEDDVLQVFGLVSRRSMEQFADAILSGNAREILRLVGAFDDAGKNMRRLCAELLSYFRNLVFCHHLGTDATGLDASPEQLRAYERQAAKADPQRLQQIAEQIAIAEDKMRYTLSARTLVELTLLKCARLATTVTFEEILRKINALRSSPPPEPAPQSFVGKNASRDPDLYDDPALRNVLKEFDGKIVGVEDGD